MPSGLTRTELQSIALAKLEDARLLLEHGRTSSSYYLAGYAVEIALKACIAKTIAAEAIQDRRFINDIFVHDLVKLVSLAGLKQAFEARLAEDPAFAENWALVVEWRPEVRYEIVDPTTAQATFSAIADESSGVFPWIRLFW